MTSWLSVYGLCQALGPSGASGARPQSFTPPPPSARCREVTPQGEDQAAWREMDGQLINMVIHQSKIFDGNGAISF